MRLQDIWSWVKGVIRNLINLHEAKEAIQTDIAVSGTMREAITRWADMFQEKSPGNAQTLGLPSAIAGELARLTIVEMESAVTGSARADFLNAEMRPLLNALRINVEYGLVGGGVVFKPYVEGGRIAVTCVPAWRFFPTSFNGRGEVTGAFFVETVQRGGTYYTRLEQHQLTGGAYTIANRAFKSSNPGAMGSPVALSSVDEWRDLEPEVTLQYSEDGGAPERMLFAYFKMPFANTVDMDSPLGVSAYSRAEGLILEADRQYRRILWEYEGSELAIDASQEALRSVDQPDGTTGYSLPENKRRLFRALGVDKGTGGDLYSVFSPEIRDSALFNGLDKLLKRIEFNCYLSYGTLSDPISVEKTAEEIRTSKQRSHSAVCDIQAALGAALQHLVWCMDFYASLYNLAPKGAYELNITWGDGILEDVDKEFVRRKALTDSDYLRPEKLVAWYLGISEEDALRDYMPNRTAPAMFPEEE